MKLSAWRKCKEIPVIYGIHNIITNKWYIGSCHNMRDRLHRHYYCLTHDQHHSPKLQKSWNKYGENAFEVIVLKSLEETSDDMFTIEEQFIKAFDSKDNGYNILDICRHVGTFKLSKESADKAGKTHSKAVIAVDRYTGKFYKRYSSLTEAAKELHASTTNISGVCSHRLRYVKGFVFIYENEYDPTKDYSVPFHHCKGVPKTEEWKAKMRQNSARAKKVYKYDLTNTLVATYNSRSEAERQNGLKKEFLRYHLNKVIDNYVYSHEIKDIV